MWQQGMAVVEMQSVAKIPVLGFIAIKPQAPDPVRSTDVVTSEVGWLAATVESLFSQFQLPPVILRANQVSAGDPDP